MNFYSRVIFPRFIDLTMSGAMMTAYRQRVLEQVEGDVLEIGFGTGLNLPHYPKTVRKIVAIDPNPTMKQLAKKRIESSSIEVEFCQLSGESLPMEDGSFDSVVCTWTLCSIPQIDRALQEIHRVLKPTGKFFFVEHGLSPDANVEGWQNRLNPIQKRVGDGCNLNRDMARLIEEADFKLEEIDRGYAEDLPKFLGYFYRGRAVKR